MDDETIRSYDRGARDFAAEWEEEQSAPDDLRAAVEAHFRPGPTVDVGCGSGRDAAWLASAGYDTLGIDASAGLIAEARRRHPGVRFETDTLPDLVTLKDGSFTNVLCETVIMHLDAEDAAASVRRLRALLAPGGMLYLSWRVTEGEDQRDPKGRLYAAFDTKMVRDVLAGMELELDERIVSVSSKKVVHRIIARQP